MADDFKYPMMNVEFGENVSGFERSNAMSYLEGVVSAHAEEGQERLDGRKCIALPSAKSIQSEGEFVELGKVAIGVLSSYYALKKSEQQLRAESEKIRERIGDEDSDTLFVMNQTIEVTNIQVVESPEEDDERSHEEDS